MKMEPPEEYASILKVISMTMFLLLYVLCISEMIYCDLKYRDITYHRTVPKYHFKCLRMTGWHSGGATSVVPFTAAGFPSSILSSEH